MKWFRRWRLGKRWCEACQGKSTWVCRYHFPILLIRKDRKLVRVVH